jgi:Carboxypeptidase regulatory-like domain
MTKYWSFCLQRTLAAFLLTAFFLAFAGAPAQSQTSGAGSINGTVMDANQAVIPGASVTVINLDNGISHSYTTNGAGLYQAPFLLPGHYEVDGTAPNFGKTQTKGITLLVGQVLTINLTLKVSAEATTVEVSDTNQILDTQKTEVSQVVDSHLVANLPVAVRNWSAFVLLTPNVTQDGSTGLVSFHGISGLYNQNYVDGANNNQILFSEARGRSNGIPYVYSTDSIKEFQAETSNYSVEFGQSAGGQVNAITKSGTDNLHGDLFYSLRYPSLNALDPYTKFQALNNTPNKTIAAFLLTQPIHQQQQFGGSVGGPIMKDRLFYFFTYDGFRQVGKVLYTDTNQISLTPAGTYDPTVKANSTLVTPNQCPTASNASYAAYLTANSLPAYYVTDAQCTAAINFLAGVSTGAPGRFSKENLFFPRLDYHINSKNDAFVDFDFANFDRTYGYNSANTNSNGSPSSNAPTSYHERILVGGLTTVVSSTAVNTVHIQWGRDLETAGANSAAPFVNMGVDSYGMVNAIPRVAEPDEHRTQISDVFSKVVGRHNLKFGGDLNNVHEVMINLYQGGGLYGYGESTSVGNFQDWIFDAFHGQAGDTDPYAGFHYNTFVQTVDAIHTKPGTQGTDDFWMNMFDVFAEDSWKMTRNLTVTAGLRWDAQFTPPPGLVNNNYAPLSSQYTQTIKNVLDRVQPRVGFSYSPFTGTVIRGGYGLFSALNQGSTYYAMRVENGVVQINYNYTGCKSSVGTAGSTCPTVPSASTKLQFPNVPFQPTGPPLSQALYPSGGTAPAVSGPSTLGPQSFHGLDPNFVPPFAHEFELSVEQAMPGNISLSVGYVGTRGMRLPVFIDSNLIGQKPSGMRTYNVLSGLGSGSTLIKQLTVPVYLPSDRRNTSLATFNTGFGVANTWYNAMAVTVKRPFQNGFEVLANYTWAHATDTGQVGGANGTFYGGDIPLDPNNIRLENGPSDTDVRNRFTLSFVYQPRIMLGNKLIKNLIDDFSFSGDEIATGGQPIYLGSGISGTIYSGSTSPSSYAVDGGIYGGAISSGSGFPTNGRPPQIGRNSIYGPGFNNSDFRITRDVPIHENIRMQFVGEAFNLVNHTIISNVNSLYSSYTAAGTSGSGLTCAQSGAAPTGSTLQGCLYPYTGTGLSAFGATSGTNSYLYGARQLQVSAKLFF